MPATRAGVAANRRDCIARILALSLAGLLTSTMDAANAAPARRTLLIVGDSLSAEYGLPRGSGWVALLERRLAERQVAATVVNASISGETTSGGRSRLSALLARHRPSHVVIELGGNDALRGLPLRMTEDNLRAMVKAARAEGAAVLLVGMQMPPNYGAAYARDFAAIFSRVAKDEKTALVPFMLAALVDNGDATKWFQPDRIHPVAAAHPLILDTIWPVMDSWLRR
ncbi:arylesterase [Sphaerotilus mobilis]|uniref:Acyl-CoA thioesterase-1 n=1 Tax=Sphaerotilus mobilis TaxID=47994 RepID=A0A4Q7LS83_9BURK|nr:acyl-CoA thioesterase-1 [Sphaerotilus mobilis]